MNQYKHFVPVEITITGGNDFDELLNDKKIQAGVSWLGSRL